MEVGASYTATNYELRKAPFKKTMPYIERELAFALGMEILKHVDVEEHDIPNGKEFNIIVDVDI